MDTLGAKSYWTVGDKLIQVSLFKEGLKECCVLKLIEEPFILEPFSELLGPLPHNNFIHSHSDRENINISIMF